MPLRATAFLRKLRGGAQAHLLRASDGACYAVKFQHNPQHRRILINEWIARAVFHQLRIATPEVAVIDLTAEFIREHPDLHIRLADRMTQPEPGWHFGSRYPGDPDQMAIYDFLPQRTLAAVANLHDFRGALVADRWLGNADARQCVFFRARVRQWAPSVAAHGSRVDFVALMIDHGFAFNGPEWTFLQAPGFGQYPRPEVYANVNGLSAFEPWMEQVRYFPESVLEAALREIPPAWLGDDGDRLDAMLEQLLRRRTEVPRLVEACRQSQRNPFPQWL